MTCFASWIRAHDFFFLHSNRFDNEMAIRQSVEADITGLKKVIDDTNMNRMNIEGEIEAVKEELAYLKKNHENVSHQHVNTHFTSPGCFPSCFSAPIGCHGAEAPDLQVRRPSGRRCSQGSRPSSDHGGHESQLWEDWSKERRRPQKMARESSRGVIFD